jgi:Tfp pilus assembly protein PilX
MNHTCRDQRGSVLVIAVIAMLVLGILSFSFALLSRLEMTTGVNYKAQAQAEALAEAGLERGRDGVRGAANEGCGFTKWTDPGNSTSYGCGAGITTAARSSP